MKAKIRRTVCALVSLGMLAQPLTSSGEDIDLFVGGSSDSTRPNILIVLDNTSNWARQSQQWPGGLQQGQSEVRAIKAALNGLTGGKVNVGLMEFVTQGNANDDGGFIRHAVKEWDKSTKTEALEAKLQSIDSKINDPIEKRNSNTAYGNLVYDVYNYLSGGDVFNSGAGTPSSLADSDGYQTQHSRFRSPLSTESICGNTYVIYITNPNASGPTTDSTANSNVLAGLIAQAGGTKARLSGENSGAPLPLPEFNRTETSVTLFEGVSDCYPKNTTWADVLEKEFSSQCTGDVPCTYTDAKQCNKGNEVSFKVSQTLTTLEITEKNTFDNASGAAWNFDDWAKFLYHQGVPFGSTRGKVVTYTIDVFNKQPNDDHSALMMSAAKVGGGRYFAAKNEQAIVDALQSIFSEILSVNSTFASAALPVTATNRSQNENQVYIPMFRPDGMTRPRWFGNLKRYEIGYADGFLALVDTNKVQAANSQTGFINDCAKSFWTSGIGFTDNDESVLNSYWESRGVSPDPVSACVTAENPYSDSPDGAFVEKGGVSEVLRKGNSKTDGLVNRTIYTQVGSGALKSFTSTNTGLEAKLVDFIRGHDVENKDGNKITGDEARISIHGDVVHSRPLPINYGGEIGVTVFYGSNDGILHAVDADTGQERWGFIAEEQFGKLKRLYDNAPNIVYPNQDANVAADNRAKDYFFDGSIASLIAYNSDNKVSKAWIYPTMRRGGRMLYALDVTAPASPAFLWKAGCVDADCTAGFSDIGQTWSVPAPALVKGYQVEGSIAPILVVGGGYDSCEDADSISPACSNAKGRVIYVLDAEEGTLLKSFPTDGPVPGDVSLVDTDNDGLADFGYAADTRGNIYRIDFVNPATMEARSSDNWTMKKIASTTGDGRKFLYAPDVFSTGAGVYLALGSGNRERPLETNYPYVDAVQDRFYVMFDQPAVDAAVLNLDNSTQMISASGTGESGPSTCSSEGVGPGANKRGWWYDFAHRGEQTVTSALIHLGTVTFSTSQAGAGQAADNVCVRPLGTARSYQLNLMNGSGAIGSSDKCDGQPFVVMAGGGIPPSPVLATVVVETANGPRKETVIIGAGEKGIANVEDGKPVVRPMLKRTYRGSVIDDALLSD